jgi:hypothetical protein
VTCGRSIHASSVYPVRSSRPHPNSPRSKRGARRRRAERDEARAQFDAASATLQAECVAHVELNGHIDNATFAHDYLLGERDKGDPSGRLHDFVASLEVVIDQCDRQRRRANWYEAAHTAGKAKLIEHATAALTTERDAARAEVERVKVERDAESLYATRMDKTVDILRDANRHIARETASRSRRGWTRTRRNGPAPTRTARHVAAIRARHPSRRVEEVMTSRLTDDELNEALAIAQGMHSLRLTAAIAELRTLRAAALSEEERAALQMLAAAVEGRAFAFSLKQKRCALSALHRLTAKEM